MTWAKLTGAMVLASALIASLTVDTAQAVDLIPNGRAVTVQGQNNPAVDRDNVQEAVNKAALVGGAGTVQLVGTFDFGSCSLCVIIPGPITISGTGDPSVSDLAGAPTTVIKTTGSAPMAVLDTGGPTGNITIERIWFNGAQTMAVMMLQVRGTFTMFHNRISGVLPGNEFRFAVAGATVGPVPTEQSASIDAAFTRLGTQDGPKLTGAVVFDGNYIDNNVPMQSGDDNGFAFAQCHLSRIQIINNFIRAGEAVEIEGCRGPGAVYVIADNRIVQTPTVSNLAQLTDTPGFILHGGHPAAIKPIDAEAALIVIQNNQIDARNAPRTGVCIMTGNTNKESTTLIERNTCVMNGQFAAILGGWAGTPNFFNASYMQNATIRENRFLGRADLGFALLNFTYLKNSDMTLINKGHDNVLYNNDVRLFRATKAAVSLGLFTHDNLIVDDLRGDVVNRGMKNTIVRRPYSPLR
ncbi:unannotated protein [freshwater metagenome]|uniref:Unannotated protein n=1 Tax=freshwater metagenome TaxID=449393 RepID=A0A6J7FUF7_9ZZZZ